MLGWHDDGDSWAGFLPRHRRTAVCMASMIAAMLGAVAHADGQSTPNIVVIVMDDLPAAALGCSGNQFVSTPHIDELAREGVRFDNSFVTTSICCVSRASLLTGQTLRRHRIGDFDTPLTPAAFAGSFPGCLRRAGYATGFMGKFGIGSPSGAVRDPALPAYEFDAWLGYPQHCDYMQLRDGIPRYLTTLVTDAAVAFVEQHAKRPFCLIVALKEPHGPFDFFDPDTPVPESAGPVDVPATFDLACFDALPRLVRESLGASTGRDWLQNPAAFQMWLGTRNQLITRADQAVGEIMQALRRTGVDRNTVVFFTSDNGHMAGAHGLSGKWLMYEESIRVPLIVRDPRRPGAARDRRRSEMVLNVDVAPTILSLASVQIPAEVEGRDLTPLLRGRDVPWREDWFYEHSFTLADGPPIPRTEGIRTTAWKYIRYPDANPVCEQLFDLSTDPHERRDRTGDVVHADMLRRLRRRCDECSLAPP